MHEKRILGIVAKAFRLPASKIKPTTQFLKDLNTDSLKMLELIADLEQEFSIKINNEELYGIKTVGDLLTLANKYLSQKV